MFCRNVSVASSLHLPETHFALDYVRPDLLGLRVISRSLILWNDIEPTSEWIERQVPSIVKNSLVTMKRAAARAMALSGVDEMCEKQTNAEDDKHLQNDFDPHAVRQVNNMIHCSLVIVCF